MTGWTGPERLLQKIVSIFSLQWLRSNISDLLHSNQDLQQRGVFKLHYSSLTITVRVIKREAEEMPRGQWKGLHWTDLRHENCMKVWNHNWKAESLNLTVIQPQIQIQISNSMHDLISPVRLDYIPIKISCKKNANLDTQGSHWTAL